MPSQIRIAVPSRDVAARLVDVLHECDARVEGLDGTWFVDVECDREFNELLLHVLDRTESYLASDPSAELRLLVDGRAYPLHPRADGDGNGRAPVD